MWRSKRNEINAWNMWTHEWVSGRVWGMSRVCMYNIVCTVNRCMWKEMCARLNHLGTWKTAAWMNEANKWNEKMVAVACTILARCFSWHRGCAFLSQSVYTTDENSFSCDPRVRSVCSINSGIFICKLFLQPSTFPATSCVHVYSLSSRPFVYSTTPQFAVSSIF